MVNPTTKTLFKGLILSATELRQMTDWSDALIEDYLNIISNLAVLADKLDIEINQKLEEVPTDLTDLTLVYVNSGFLASLGVQTDGQLVIGSTGNAPVINTLTGTINQITIVNAAGSITLSLPQNIHIGATPTFAKLLTDEVRAIDGDGLKLYDDNENGIFVEDGGNIGIDTITPGAKLQVIGDCRFGSENDYTEIEADGTIEFVGDATVWDDLRVPATNTKLTPSKSEPNFEILINGLYVHKFDTTNADDESIHFVAQIPHTYKEGTDLLPHLHWCPDSTDNGNVFWSFEYTIANINGTFGASVTDEITIAADGISLKHQVEPFTPIDGTGLTISHMLVCRLTRKSSSEAGDTFTGNACFLEFDFHHEVNTVGSRQEFIK